MNPKSRTFFLAAPLLLIATVFCVTWAFSFLLPPLFLAIPLLLAYYGFIWGSVALYQRRLAKGEDGPVLKYAELRPSYARLTAWMLAWTIAYPLLAGAVVAVRIMWSLPAGFIALGVLFALVNGPSEEIFWRLLLERAGRDGGLSTSRRLWYASTVFSAWHFVFVVFLLPAGAVAMALVLTLGSTFVAGLLWMRVYQKTANMFPNILSHTVLNALVIWPSVAFTVQDLMPLH
ncbi:MAG: CPBP family intramembrane metalloprotease [Proteobacteria bacterium]|nr:CPBP family intramembrane metalloprotease [Pseudomonadota bacterium]